MIRDTVNQVQFYLRQRVFGKVALRTSQPHLEALDALQNEYQYYNLLLSRGFPQELGPEIEQVVDVGCRNWSYVRALAEFFPLAGISGIEVDGARRYWNLHRRIDVAIAYADQLQKEGRKAQACLRNFLDWDEALPAGKTLFCFFFPFVSENPCLKWGLPLKFADFAALLKHSKYLSRGSNPFWISAHQGEWESAEAQEAYAQAGIQIRETAVTVREFQDFWPSSYETRILSSI